MTRDLQTRNVGFTTHQSGHVMAPPDIVFEVVEEEAPRRRPSLLQKTVAIAGLLGAAWMVFVLVLDFTTGIEL